MMKKWTVVALCLLLGTVFTAKADLGVEHTRLIVNEGARAVSTRVWNRGATTSLVQVWLDTGDASSSPESVKSPYAITPPMFRLESGRNRDILLHPIDIASLRRDRESVFWLNLLDVPARRNAGGKNHIDYAFRWRMKVFHRPAGLEGKAKDAAALLRWSVGVDSRNVPHLWAENTTPYHVSLDHVSIEGSVVSLRADRNLIAPFSTWSMPIADFPVSVAGDQSIAVTWIDDAGKRHSLEALARPGNAKADDSRSASVQ